MPGRTRPRSLRLFLCVEEAGRWPIVVLSQGRPFLQLVVGGGYEGALIFCLIRGMRPDTIFPLTSTKLPLYLAGGDDGDSDEGDRQRHRQRQRQRLSSAPETSSETSVGGLEILPIEIFFVERKKLPSLINFYYLLLYLTLTPFFYSGVGFCSPYLSVVAIIPGQLKKETRTVVCGINNKNTSRFALSFIYLFIYSFIRFYPSVPSLLGGIKQTGGLHTRAMCVVKTDAQLVRQSIHLGE